MDLINKQELTDLLGKQEGVHISLFMPLEREPDKYEMNRIRLKNLIKQGKEQLTAAGFLPTHLSQLAVESLFEPAENLLSGGRLDVEQGRGLALFLSPNAQHIHRLPISTEELILIGPRFHIKPLLPVVNGGGRFYLLSLSQKQVQLWQGDEFTLEPVDVPGLPDSMDEALALEDPEHMNPKELRMLAWETVQPHFEEAQKAVITRYENVSGSENGSQTLEEIVPAATYGRVDTLLIPTENGVQQWGRFDPDTGEVETAQEGDFNAGDLVNLAAITTIENGGTIHALDPADMPNGAALAAIFRYAV